MSGSFRQTLALEAKLVRDAERAEREDAVAEAKRDREQVRFRKDRLKTAVEALVWRETDDIADQVGRVLTRLGIEIAPDETVRRSPAPTPAIHDSA
ncbi:hypothetical protein [Phenylobacterium sp.]|uniref:hypothetical protein n=1 Tax=Phenylobacterium sp. TaxID=1871053 RepID=UPI002811D6E4|nr:hypothetical protein [Phenylobacterium sp.]